MMFIRLSIENQEANLTDSRIFFRSRITIGRLEGDIVLNDRQCSRTHLILEIDNKGRLVLKDTGSLNGTFLNDQRVEKAYVEKGDEIRIGDTTIRVLACQNDIVFIRPGGQPIEQNAR